MSLADERKAIRDGITASRAATSEVSRTATSESSREASRQAIAAGRQQSSEAARRAIGRSLEEQRRGKTLQDDLNSLKPGARQSKTLSAREASGGRPATRGSATWDPATPAAAGGGGGIASPLTEKTKTEGAATVPDRDYYGTVVVATSDGIFTMEIKPIKTIKLADADGADVVVNLAEPAP